MGYFIYDNAIFQMEDIATRIIDMSDISYPFRFLGTNVRSFEELDEILISKNAEQRLHYKIMFEECPAIDIGMNKTDSPLTINLYGEPIYTEFYSGKKEINPNLHDYIKDILLDPNYNIITKYKSLHSRLPIKAIAPCTYKIGTSTNVYDHGNALIYKSNSSFKVVGNTMHGIFGDEIMERLTRKYNIACLGTNSYISAKGPDYLKTDFKKIIKELNKNAFILFGKDIVIDGNTIKYDGDEFFIKSSPDSKKWYVSGDFENILSMFGVSTRAELNSFISLKLGTKRRDGLFPFCDSKEEIIQLVKSIPDE